MRNGYRQTSQLSNQSAVKPQSSETQATIPLTSGYFVAAVPTALIADNPKSITLKSITLKWIDLHRN
jgi:hypothetical protein